MRAKTFKHINLQAAFTPGHIKGTATIGDDPTVEFDRTVDCGIAPTGTFRIGVGGAGGKQAAHWDNLLIDVTP